MSAEPRTIACPLCGNRFPGRESCVAGCPLSGSCRTVCCPNCHYRFVVESTLVRLVTSVFKKRDG